MEEKNGENKEENNDILGLELEGGLLTKELDVEDTESETVTDELKELADSDDAFISQPISLITDDVTNDDSDEDEETGKEVFDGTENKLRVVLSALRSVELQVKNAIALLEDGSVSDASAMLGPVSHAMIDAGEEESHDGRIVEGVFDGQHMIGSDGKNYTVPPNYASKSKLVEGDMLKLTISPKGSFIFKQIGPIERSRVVGDLGFDQTIGQYYATSEGRRWNILRASVTYFKGEAGDEIILLLPQNAPSKWAAVENIISTSPLE